MASPILLIRLDLLRVKDGLREVASNPLILSLICLVHWQRRDLPRGRTALYGECLQILLDLWDRIDKDLNQAFPTFDQKRRLLRRIAHRMHTRGMREIDRPQLAQWVLEFLPDTQTLDGALQLVKQIEIRSGVLSERAIDQLASSHLTLQEYLVVDYYQIEPGAELQLSGIDDWSKCREPLLSLIGSSSSPMKLLRELYSLQPILAIYAIAEIDLAHLELAPLQEVLSGFVTELVTNAERLHDGIPALVSLVALEGRPFDVFVFDFVAEIPSRVSLSRIIQFYRDLM